MRRTPRWPAGRAQLGQLDEVLFTLEVSALKSTGAVLVLVELSRPHRVVYAGAGHIDLVHA